MWTFYHNQNGLHSSSIAQSVPRTTYLKDAGFGDQVSKGSDVTCRFSSCPCVCVCTVHDGGVRSRVK